MSHGCSVEEQRWWSGDRKTFRGNEKHLLDLRGCDTPFMCCGKLWESHDFVPVGALLLAWCRGPVMAGQFPELALGLISSEARASTPLYLNQMPGTVPHQGGRSADTSTVFPTKYPGT